MTTMLEFGFGSLLSFWVWSGTTGILTPNGSLRPPSITPGVITTTEPLDHFSSSILILTPDQNL